MDIKSVQHAKSILQEMASIENFIALCKMECHFDEYSTIDDLTRVIARQKDACNTFIQVINNDLNRR